MQKVRIYTGSFCPYCHMAKELLRRKGAQFEEIDVSRCQDTRAAMRNQAGGRDSLPQIWIGDTHIGGCDDLLQLDRAGKLDPLLAA